MASPIVIAVGLDTGNAQLAAQQLASQLRSALGNVDQDVRNTGRNIQSGLGSPLQAVLGQLKGFTAITAGFAAGSVVAQTLSEIGRAAVKVAVDVDKTRQTLVALTGSTEAANAKLAELRQLAAKSPGVTSSFAADLFAQFKAIGSISDQTINTTIKSIGRLNAAFTLPDPQQFARNLQQIFSQGFERADIKEALGQVPIFEQLLEQAFGTKDAEKLRQLKAAGKLTAETYFNQLATTIENDPRFGRITESLGSRLQKGTEALLASLEPVGKAVLDIIVPAIESFGKTLGDNRDSIQLVVNEVGNLLDLFNDLDRWLTTIFGDAEVVRSSLQAVAVDLALLKDSIELTLAAFEGGLRAISAAIYGTLRKALSLLGLDFKALNEEAENNFNRLLQNVDRLTGGFSNVRRVDAERAFADQQGKLSPEQRSQLATFFGDSALGSSGAAVGTPPRTNNGRVPGLSGGGEVGKATQQRKQLNDALVNLERERIDSQNRLLEAEGDAREKLLQRQLESGLISYKQYNEEVFKLQEASLKRQLTLANFEALQAENDLKQARGKEKIDTEAKLLKLYSDQLVTIEKLNIALDENFETYKKRNALPAFDLAKATQEEVEALTDPRVAAAQEKLAQANTIRIEQETSILEISRRKVEIENLLERGVITQSQARQEINALLRQERDIRINMLEIEKTLSVLTPQRRAEIDLEIESLRTLGEELTSAQRFMRGFNSQVEDTGDAFERLGANISRSFANVKGLLDGLKQSLTTFFRDLLGLGLQRVFSQLLGNFTGRGGGANQAGSGGLSGLLGGIFNQVARPVTPGFAGGFPAVGGGGVAGAGALSALGGLLGGGGQVSLIGNLPVVNTAGIGALGQATLAQRFQGATGLAALGGLSGLFKGFGFGLPRGGASGALAGVAPLLGVSLGSGLGGSSRLGQILGGAGGAALGIGLTAAPAALASLGLGALAPLFSNPITAVVGGVLLAGGLLLGRSKQRQSDEQQAGVWLQEAINNINALRDQAQSGSLTLAQARQVFESQILATFVSQINTLKTKSVRESRLTNQVRDLRNLFESSVVPAIQQGSRTATIRDRLVPEFNDGGIVPGIDRGFDSVLAAVRPGEMVLTRGQQSVIQSIAGSGIFQAAGVPNGASVSNGLPSFMGGGTMPPMIMPHARITEPLELNITLVMGKDDATKIVVAGSATPLGQRGTMTAMKRITLA